MLIRQKIGDLIVTAVQLPDAPPQTLLVTDQTTTVVVSPNTAVGAQTPPSVTVPARTGPAFAAWAAAFVPPVAGFLTLSVIGPVAEATLYPLASTALSAVLATSGVLPDRPLAITSMSGAVAVTAAEKGIVGLAGVVPDQPDWAVAEPDALPAWRHFAGQVVRVLGGPPDADSADAGASPALTPVWPTMTRPTPDTVYVRQGDAAGLFWTADAVGQSQQLLAGAAWPAVAANGRAIVTGATDTWAGWHTVGAAGTILTRHTAAAVSIQWQTPPVSPATLTAWWPKLLADDAALHDQLRALQAR
ncbi:hypothetical protein [Schleiferilactobacillus shenzhenensis]|uniref:Uncharacterized protein n=1 Tax=Schleiferilactobacillus shenzhenensis LY-73 TaxID=1231336 RepID=U4TXI3_9LACO|nr:hypothetical protein [Schleiferilactobacillus shenzhenensis]ERL66523.1 hypothetical protein L248_0202 [Schleiferilactobacillus shenzhenensis LY-73]